MPYDRSGSCLARRGGYLGRFVLSFLLPCCWCAFLWPLCFVVVGGVVPCLPCGLANGGGIACPVFLANAVWACVAANLNIGIDFRSGVWVGCPLCFVGFTAGMVSVVLLGCGWGCMVGVVWPWHSTWQGGEDFLRRPGSGECGGLPLLALVLGWMRAWWGGVHGFDI